MELFWLEQMQQAIIRDQCCHLALIQPHCTLNIFTGFGLEQIAFEALLCPRPQASLGSIFQGQNPFQTIKFSMRGAVAKWSKALQERENKQKNHKDPGFAPGLGTIKKTQLNT